MKSLVLSWAILIFANPLNSLAAGKMAVSPEATEAYNEIRSTFGMIPTFLKEFPQEALPGAWQEFRDIQISPATALNAKTKDLIGLAVASQIPCSYCIYFHRKAAKFNGATPQEMNFAVAVASSARKWSAHFYGAQTSMDSFKADIGKIINSLKASAAAGAPPKAVMAMDATAANKDMEKTLGFSPGFMKDYSGRGFAGAWNEFRTLEMNHSAPLTNKSIFLISLAVSAQIPCDYCVYGDTEFAKFYGASPEELQETIAMSGVVRHWSTFLNGIHQPQKSFEREVDHLFKNLELKREHMNKKISSR